MRFFLKGLVFLLVFPSGVSIAQFTQVLPYCHVGHGETPFDSPEVRKIWKAMTQLQADPAVASLLAPIIHEQASRFGLDPFVMVAIARQESNFRLDARGSRGEVGVFQIMPNLWCDELGLTEEELRRPEQNTYACAYILSRHLEAYEEYPAAIKAYNHRIYGTRYAKAVLTRYEEITAQL